MIDIGKKIKYLRKLKRMSQSELAEKIGVTYQQVQKYEKNTSSISCEKIKKLAEALNVPVSYFFDEIELENSNKTDSSKETIKNWIDIFYTQATEKEKIWFEIQFSRCFPEFLDWLKKKEEK